ncbi:MAG: DUF262 domain-containing protein [Desulfobacteraceae bacterium]|nr:MAG: DUF262 domain-containing protein [Desulfobacteraceae bacterium]
MPKIDTTVRELVDMIKRGELRLPEMQRRYVWPATRVRDLLDSLYRGYPSGAILIWETDISNPIRDLPVHQDENIFATQKLLLDGQQRLTSLYAVISGDPIKVRNRKKPIEILFNLDHPDISPDEFTEIEDDMDSPTLTDDELEEEDENGDEFDIQHRLSKRTFVVYSKQLAANPKWIKVTDVFKGLNEWTILKPLKLQPDDSQYEKYSQRIQKLRKITDYPYVMQVLPRDLNYIEVAEIFVRVNSLGVKLRGSDLAMAQVTARWQNSLKLFEEFADEMDQNTLFTLDIGLLIRAIVVYATKQCRFRTVQNIPVPRLKEAWEFSKQGIQYAINFLKTNVGIEDESLLSSPFIILILAVYGSNKKFKLSTEEEKILRQWTLLANVKGRYSRGSTESFLDQDLSHVFKNEPINSLITVLEQQVGRLSVSSEDMENRGARSPLFASSYLALKALGAKDWFSGLGLSLTHQGKLHYIEHHHIFPKSLLAHYGYEKGHINEIANLAFISGKANRKIQNKEPKDYLQGIVDDFRKEALLLHAIPDDPTLWQIQNYPLFLQWRRKRLCEIINNFIQTTPNSAHH